MELRCRCSIRNDASEQANSSPVTKNISSPLSELLDVRRHGMSIIRKESEGIGHCEVEGPKSKSVRSDWAKNSNWVVGPRQERDGQGKPDKSRNPPCAILQAPFVAMRWVRSPPGAPSVLAFADGWGPLPPNPTPLQILHYQFPQHPVCPRLIPIPILLQPSQHIRIEPGASSMAASLPRVGSYNLPP